MQNQSAKFKLQALKVRIQNAEDEMEKWGFKMGTEESM